MANVLPFQRSGLLISEIDEYLDRVIDAILVLEQTLSHYVGHGPDDYLDERLVQVREIESRGDELRRNIAAVMYTEMLMPDTRGDILLLLDEVDTILDDCAHIIVSLALERPELPDDSVEDFKSIIVEVSKAGQVLIDGARAYFKEPQAVRNYLAKIDFHEQEATNIVLRQGRRVFDSDLPLERKRQLRDWIVGLRRIASHASDVGDQLAIFAVKRTL